MSQKHKRKVTSSQFEVIQNELDRFEQKLSEAEEEINAQELSADGHGEEGASSCSFEDFDEEQLGVNSLELSPMREGAQDPKSLIERHEASIARGHKHVDSLKTSTVFEDLVDGQSPSSFRTPHQEQPETVRIINNDSMKAKESEPSKAMVQSMLNQLGTLQEQLRQFESNLGERHEFKLIKEAMAAQAYDAPSSSNPLHRREMTLNDLEMSKREGGGRGSGRAISSDSEIDPKTWIGLRSSSQKAAIVTVHEHCDHAPREETEAQLKPVPRLCRLKNKKASNRGRSRQSKSRSNSRTKSRARSTEPVFAENHVMEINTPVAGFQEYIVPLEAQHNFIANKGFCHNKPPQHQPQQTQQQPFHSQTGSVSSLGTTVPPQVFYSKNPSFGQAPSQFNQSVEHQQHHQFSVNSSVQGFPIAPGHATLQPQPMYVPCSTQSEYLIEHFKRESAQQKAQIDKLKKQATKMKGQIQEKDKTLAKQKAVYKEMRVLREKCRATERERLQQDYQIRELKTQLATCAKENLALKKKLHKKEGKMQIKRTLLKSDPISSSWISPIDESITPIRHVILSKKGEVISQEQLFD